MGCRTGYWGAVGVGLVIGVQGSEGQGRDINRGATGRRAEHRGHKAVLFSGVQHEGHPPFPKHSTSSHTRLFAPPLFPLEKGGGSPKPRGTRASASHLDSTQLTRSKITSFVSFRVCRWWFGLVFFFLQKYSMFMHRLFTLEPLSCI